MPTYEYKCEDCEEQFEFFQKMTEEPVKVCPMCGGDLQRLISGGIGVIFKGSGFYTTDYKNSSNHISTKKDSAKEKESSSTSASDSSSSKKESESSSAKKTEAASK